MAEQHQHQAKKATENDTQQDQEFERDVEGFQVPVLEELKKASNAVVDLEEAEVEKAHVAMSDINVRDRLKTMRYGLEPREAASQVTRDFISDVRDADLEGPAAELRLRNAKMKELNFGDLKENRWVSWLPFVGKSADKAVDAFLDKHKSLSEMLDESQEKSEEQTLRLAELHERMQKKIEENEVNYQRQTQDIVTLEFVYAASEKELSELREQANNQKSSRLEREIALLQQANAALKAQINTQYASRQETLNATNMMDRQLQGIEMLMQRIQEQSAFNRQAWDNTVLMVATNEKMKDSVEAVRYDREQIEDMLKGRTGDIRQTISDILHEMENGVVNVAVFELITEENRKMNAEIILGLEKIKSSMEEANKIHQKLDGSVKEVLTAAALSNEDDLQMLSDLVSMPEPVERKKAGNE